MSEPAGPAAPPAAQPPTEVEPPAVEVARPAVEMVLPLVVRIERDAPPARTPALEAAARAVLLVVSTTAPAWREPVAAWEGARIRKVVRRARGAEWRRAEALEGLTVEHAGAQVRVHPPVPLDGWPRDLRRLQVSGTDLHDPQPPGPPPPGAGLVLLSPHVAMSAGKAMAQAGHAAQLGLRAMAPAAARAWAAAGFPVAVRQADPATWSAVLAGPGPVVRDAGFTEVAPGSATAAFSPPSPGTAQGGGAGARQE